MASKNAAYWKKRFEQMEAAQYKKGAEAYAHIEEQYSRAQKQIENEIRVWYQRFADNNEITLQEAHKMLTSKELAEFKWDVNDYIKYGEENAMNGKWMKELENASAKYHISRLQSLEMQMQQQCEVLFGNQLDTIDDAMRDIFTSGYYHTAFEIQKGIEVGWDFASLDTKTIDKVINKPWAPDGKNFSERVWDDREKLVNELDQELVRGIITGQDPQKTIDAIAHRMNVSKSNAGRLVMTEEAYFSSEAQKDCFKELDVEKFEVVETLDSTTCEECAAMDGKVFPMSEWEVGITVPPFHPRCRGTTAPAFDDEFDKLGERAARGEEGETYYVPTDMAYKQWEAQFVNGGSKENLTSVDGKSTIKVTNMAEAKKALVDTVGFDMVESSFDSIDEKLAVSNTNQLIKLEDKFGIVHQSEGTIGSVADGNAIAYVSSSRFTPTHQNLSLCPKSYRLSSESFAAKEKRDVEAFWSMPCALTDEELSIYSVTHEYGHMIENTLIQREMEAQGWTASDPTAFRDSSKKTAKARTKWYDNISNSVEKQCFTEITDIAKKNNPDFSLKDNLSEYGRKNYAEFFAETFANSQLSKPNELGNAMNTWLKQKGLVK